MQLDVLKLMTLDKPGYVLDGAYDIIKATTPTEGFLFHVKQVLGFPIDVRRYGWDSITQSFYLYDQQTEGDAPFGWEDPTYIKIHTGNLNRGIRICPRYPKTLPVTTREAHSPFMIISAGKWDYAPHEVDATECTLNAPETINWGGDVKTQISYRLDYKSNGRAGAAGKDSVVLEDNKTLARGTYLDWEKLWYSMSWGLLRWEHWKLINGKYVMDDHSLSLKLQNLDDWKKTYPTLTGFAYTLPFMKA